MTKKQELETLCRNQTEAKHKICQYKNRVKLLLNGTRDKEHRAKTRRLIQHGAILESVFPVKDI